MNSNPVRWCALVASTLAAVWSLKLAVQMSMTGIVWTTIVFLGLVFTLRSFYAAVTSIVGALVVGVLALQLIEIILGSSITPLSGTAVVIVFLVALVISTPMCCAIRVRTPSFSEAGTVFAMSLILCWLSRDIPRTAADALQLLASSGEDSAAWLEAMSKSTTLHGAVLTPQSSYGGGFASGVAVVLLRILHLGFSNKYVNGVGANGIVLVRSMFLFAALAAFGSSAAAVHLLRRSPVLPRIMSAVAAGLLAYTMSIGMSSFGHFSASLAGLLCLIGVSAALNGTHSNGWSSYALSFLAIGSFITAGLSWYPMMLLAFVITLVLALFVAYQAILWGRSRRRRLVGLLPLLLVIPISYAVRRLFASVIANLNWDYFSFNSRLVGGVQPISGFVALAGLVAIAVLGGSTWRSFKQLTISRAVASLASMGLVAYVTAIYLVAFLISPYAPQYGALKLLYVGSMVSVPLIPVAVGRHVNRRAATTLVQLSVGPVLIMSLALIDPGRMLFSWPNTVKPVAPWSAAVVNELEREPSRNLVCLNTLIDTSQNYSGYLCTRMANGFQGKSNYTYNTWTAANIGQIPPEQAADAWDSNFYRHLTILLLDPSRLNNGEEQQKAWLADVRWRAVKLIGPNGELIKKPGARLSSVSPALVQ